MSVSSTNHERSLTPDSPEPGNGRSAHYVHAAPSADNGSEPATGATPAPRHTNRIAGDPPDETLLANYRGGDRKSFAQLVERYQRELFHFLVRFLGDRAAAEDIFQETFLQVHQSAAQFDPSRRFRPWLFTIAADRKSTRLNSSHSQISYAVFCLKKKTLTSAH